MRRILALTAALFGLSLVGCDSTGPDPLVLTPENAVLRIVQGDSQFARVTEDFEAPVGAQLLIRTDPGASLASMDPGVSMFLAPAVTDHEVPQGFQAAAGELVCFDVDPKFARIANACDIADSLGIALALPIAEKKSGKNVPIRAFVERDGQIIAIDTAFVTVGPGGAYWSWFRNVHGTWTRLHGSVADPCRIRDVFGNGIDFDYRFPAYAEQDGDQVWVDSIGSGVAEVLVADTVYGHADFETVDGNPPRIEFQTYDVDGPKTAPACTET